MSPDSFGSAARLIVDDRSYGIHRLDAVPGAERLPYSLKVILENALRTEDGEGVTAETIEAIAGWDPAAAPSTEIQFSPARVLLQDLAGIPSLLDLAALRERVGELGGDPARVSPLRPADLVVDHSVNVDLFGRDDAMDRNLEIDFARNLERYELLRWAQQEFAGLRIVPPGVGIVHQVNIEHLSSVTFVQDTSGGPLAYPDTLVGTDSHTTMANGLGVLGWGVGGIEAEAVMLGQPIPLLLPRVVGFRLSGEIPRGVTATDVVLTITEILRGHGVVGSFVEFFGDGVASLPLANRATIGNMSPEFGSTAAMFPVDAVTLDYLRTTGRDEERIRLVEAYSKEQGLWREPGREPVFSETVELDLSTVVPSMAGPRRPQERVPLRGVRERVRVELETRPPSTGTAEAERDGMVAIAAITSCTNTSNPELMVSAGLLARNAVAKGLHAKSWVKTSLAPGSRVVTDYLDAAGLTAPLDELGFNLVGYGCTTCMGNSGPLAEEAALAVATHRTAAAAVLSGNRNFEGRIHPDISLSFIASPPLVVAYAIAGTVDFDFESQPLGADGEGDDVYLRDVWPDAAEVDRIVHEDVTRDRFVNRYATVFDGTEEWRALPAPRGEFRWRDKSMYIRRPPFLDEVGAEPEPETDIVDARVLALLGDSVTTDQISPSGAIPASSPPGGYLTDHGVERGDFNSYGARRGDHRVMLRGTFGSPRLRNGLVPGAEGAFTRDFTLPGGPLSTIFDASAHYRASDVPLVVLAGAEYGTGSSRDWAAKGTALLGVRAVIAKSFERIHRSNLVGMGVLPLQFAAGDSIGSLRLDGTERFTVRGIAEAAATPGLPLEVEAERADGARIAFRTLSRIDTPREAEYFRHGGILPYMLRQFI
jgi:aconitate hydratase